MIRLEKVSAGIGKVGILHEIDLHVPPGALLAVLGANGAGKTTLLRAISRLLPVAAGEIRFQGASINHLEPHRVACMGLVHVPQGRQIIPNLSVEDNLLIGARRVPGLAAADIRHNLEQEYARFPILRERRQTMGGSVSGGEQQMLAISRALMMRPKVLMLDEPSLGLAPLVVDMIMKALQELCATGVTIVLVEQAALTALEIAHYGYVLQTGRIVLSGTSQELLAHPELIRAYLG